MHPGEISIEDYKYDLPTDRIANHPLHVRDDSKLLIYKNGNIDESNYSHLASFIPSESLMVFNDTRVIPARVLFKKDTGAVIEIFCLEPFGIEKDYVSALRKTGNSQWKVMIGGAAKWKTGALKKKIIHNNEEVILEVSLVEKLDDSYVTTFSWQPSEYSFAKIIQLAGDVPLPPYIKREVEQNDQERYQTIYSNYEGSVAAPTAGLHFTENIFKDLDKKNVRKSFVTLHVGAGTFKPVKAAKMKDHHMHAEWLDVDKRTIAELIAAENEIIAVGTTATRTLESLYWMGVKTLLDSKITNKDISLNQWDVYEKLNAKSIDKKTALESLMQWMEKNNLERIFTQTELLIAPGYQFRVIDALITNFHQPGSTLLLLVAAAVGNDWKKIYNYALENNFRFLSYGDGSLIYL